MDFIPRKEYLDFLQRFREKQLIKVISGVRRCGKSTLFTLFQQQLRKDHVLPEQIIYLNFEDMQSSSRTDYNAMNAYMLEQCLTDKMNYIFRT